MIDSTVIDRPTELAPDMYSEVNAQLTTLEDENKNLAFDYRDPKGAGMARSQIHKLKGLNGATDRRHKELKADILEKGRFIDGAKNKIKERIAAMIAVHKEPLDQIKAEEEARAAAIQEAIDAITKPMTDLMTTESNSDDIAAAIDKVESFEINADTYGDRLDEALELRDSTLAEARIDHEKMVKHEEEQAELVKLREQQAEQARKDREADIAREAAENARQEEIRLAEAKAREAEAERDREREVAARIQREAEEREAQAKADADAAELRAKQAEQQRVADAKAAKVEADRRAEEAKQQAIAEQQRKEQEGREAEAKRLADEQHVEAVKQAAADALIPLYEDGEIPSARDIVDWIADGKIPSVTINF